MLNGGAPILPVKMGRWTIYLQRGEPEAEGEEEAEEQAQDGERKQNLGAKTNLSKEDLIKDLAKSILSSAYNA